MRIALFCHSLLSDWNHGNAHFLRGICTELSLLGHDVRVYEPVDAWSATNLVADHGELALHRTRRVYPHLEITRYDKDSLDLEELLSSIDLAIVHEWNSHDLVARIGRIRRRNPRLRVLFHDTHHRMVSDRESMNAYDLGNYDGVLAFGEVLRDAYQKSGRVARAYTWHEAADTRMFFPQPRVSVEGDLVWIGNWGDEERTAEISEFLIGPSSRLALRTDVFGVRYPAEGLAQLERAGIRYRGYQPNYGVPETFSRFLVTVHIPRRHYVRSLQGIPTIRPFEALACGIPLISAPWDDCEGLFRAGRDYLIARNGDEMERVLYEVLHDQALRHELSCQGRKTILDRHTCAHRAQELLRIAAELGLHTNARSSESATGSPL